MATGAQFSRRAGRAEPSGRYRPGPRESVVFVVLVALGFLAWAVGSPGVTPRLFYRLMGVDAGRWDPGRLNPVHALGGPHVLFLFFVPIACGALALLAGFAFSRGFWLWGIALNLHSPFTTVLIVYLIKRDVGVGLVGGTRGIVGFAAITAVLIVFATLAHTLLSALGTGAGTCRTALAAGRGTPAHRSWPVRGGTRDLCRPVISRSEAAVVVERTGARAAWGRPDGGSGAGTGVGQRVRGPAPGHAPLRSRARGWRTRERRPPGRTPSLEEMQRDRERREAELAAREHRLHRAVLARIGRRVGTARDPAEIWYVRGEEVRMILDRDRTREVEFSYDELTGEEVARLGGPCGPPRRKGRQRVSWYLEALGSTPYSEDGPGARSIGTTRSLAPSSAPYSRSSTMPSAPTSRP